MDKASADINQLVARGYDRIADRYLERYSVSAVRSQKLAELCEGLPAHARVLSAAAPASVARQLVDCSFVVTDVDASASQIERARRNVLEAQFIAADMMAVELPGCAFDAVAAFYSITHLPRDERSDVLKRITGWLKSGGRLLASFGVTPFDGYQAGWLGIAMF
ncbi:MAG TPA: class I SAM-dependent methyltransferase [Bradyrhizobium sp.]|nr:class I SAM-dependent methyltransferase [Bradyrhizobium sp.]